MVRTASLAALGVALAGAAAAQPLLSPAALEAKLGDPALAIIDIRKDVSGGVIPGAAHAPYGEAGWRAAVNGVPGMLPPVDAIEATIAGLGVDAGDHVVIVAEGEGPRAIDMGSATRVYWTFKALGHDTVSILERGAAGWTAAGLPLAAPETPARGTFAADFRPELLATASTVAAALVEGETLVDGRPLSQFRGESKSPVAQRAGALPGAVNYPVAEMLDETGGTFLDAETLAARFAAIGVETGEPAIAYCNTGHWASVAWFALSEVVGAEDVSMYDGSMADWTAVRSRPLLPAGAPAAPQG
jgi:thiosulfate/3-mercaptopyruvate sulfurtransferase